jgi:hypothetical protein
MSLPPDLQPSEVQTKDPSDPRYRRSWRYYNRPYAGCGFLWTALLILLLWWLASTFFPRTVH